MPCLVNPDDVRHSLTELPAALDEPSRHHARQQPLVGVYLAVFFFALSKGPIFQIRQRFSAVHGDFIDDHAVQAVFTLIYVAAFAMYRGAWSTLRRCRALPLALGGLCLVLLASTLWSYAPWRTGQQAVMFTLGTAAAVLAGVRARPTTVVCALAASQQFGTLLGRWAIYRHWNGSLGTTGFWQGVYYNRNSYGMTATLAFASTCAVGLLIISRVSRMRRLGSLIIAGGLLVLSAGCIVVDIAVIRNTRSLTPTAGVVIAVIAAVVVAALPKGWRQRRYAPQVLTFACLAGGALGWQVALTLRDRFSRSIGRTPDLAGRTPIWSTLREYFWHRPIGGWGFFAVWLDPAIHKELLTKTYDVFEAHTGYYEIAVGAGFLGILALTAALATCVYCCSAAACRANGFDRIWPIPVAVFVLAVNVTETYIAANVLPWALLVVVSAGALGSGDRQQRTRSASTQVRDRRRAPSRGSLTS
jgi:O-antigen ligase